MLDAARARTVLALRPGALGDALVTVPALRVLRAAYPSAHLTFASNGPAARLMAQVGEVNLGLTFDDSTLSWLFGDGAPAAPPDLLVAWVGTASPLRERLRAWPGRMALGMAPRREDHGRHAAAQLMDALVPLGVYATAADGEVPQSARPLRVQPTPVDEVLIHVGSGSATKNWPTERFAAVVAALRARGVLVRLVVGEADHDVAAAVAEQVAEDIPVLAASLDELARRLAGCRAYLGNDSGVSHLAGLCGARTVAMFGPTAPAVWQPLGPRVTVLPFENDPARVVAQLLRD